MDTNQSVVGRAKLLVLGALNNLSCISYLICNAGFSPGQTPFKNAYPFQSAKRQTFLKGENETSGNGHRNILIRRH